LCACVRVYVLCVYWGGGMSMGDVL